MDRMLQIICRRAKEKFNQGTGLFKRVKTVSRSANLMMIIIGSNESKIILVPHVVSCEVLFQPMVACNLKASVVTLYNPELLGTFKLIVLLDSFQPPHQYKIKRKKKVTLQLTNSSFLNPLINFLFLFIYIK